MITPIILFLLISSAAEQRQGDWVLTYQFRYEGKEAFDLDIKDISVEIQGEVGNTTIIPDYKYKKSKPFYFKCLNS